MKKIMLSATAFMFAVAMYAQTGTTTPAPKQTTPKTATVAPSPKPAEAKGENKGEHKGEHHKGKGHHKK